MRIPKENGLVEETNCWHITGIISIKEMDATNTMFQTYSYKQTIYGYAFILLS